MSDGPWAIYGPTCPVVITLFTFPGGMLGMKLTDVKTGGPPPELLPAQSYGFTPEQCDQLEDALRAARERRPEAAWWKGGDDLTEVPK